jgi:predicted permease
VVESGVVSGNFFSVLQVRPALGRFFLPEEDRTPRTHAVAVLSHRFWRERFTGDSTILARAIVLNGVPFTVVGVADESFHGSSVVAPDLWVPMMAKPWLGSSVENLTTSRGGAWLMAIGRLKPDVGISQAQADLATIAAQLRQAYTDVNEGHGVRVMPVSLFPGDIQRIVALFVTFLFVLTGLVLLIAGTNVAGMLLARTAARRREIAVRLAIGASRARLVRQFITESAVLFLVAGVAGTVIARWMLTGLLALIPQLPLQVAIEPSVDWRVVLFALVVSLGAGLLAGLAPALQSTRPALAPELRSDVGGSGRKHRLRSGLLVAQMAFSMLLLVTAGLFGRALMRAKAIDPGFDARGVNIAMLDLNLVNHTAVSGAQFLDRLVERARSLPGAQNVALARMIPLDGGGMGLGPIQVDGREAPDREGGWNADWNIVTPGYLDLMRIPLVTGRDFRADDRDGSPDVAIINQTLAATIWPGEDAIGKVIRNDERSVTVIGVARNSKYRTLGEDPRGFIYVPLAQRYNGNMSLLVRTEPGIAMTAPIRGVVAELDPSLPIVNAQTLEEHAAVGLFPQRVALWVAASLGGVALLLALLGIYGVTAFGVAQRTREIGIRIALGSSRREVLRLVLAQGIRLGGIGVAVGTACREQIPSRSVLRQHCFCSRRCSPAGSRRGARPVWIRWLRFDRNSDQRRSCRALDAL